MTDYVSLMQQMIDDQKKIDTRHEAGAYWLPHTQSMVSIVEKHGIENFRSIPEKALTAFATGSPYKPDLNINRKFWGFHNAIKKLPVLKKIPEKYEEIIGKAYNSAKGIAQSKLMLIYAYLQENAPELLDVEEKIYGNPVTFNIDNKVYSEVYLHKLHELYTLSQHIDLKKISSVFEVGGSFGLLGTALLNSFPNIKRYILLDVAPVPAFAEYYLSQCFPGEVQSYSETINQSNINLDKIDKRITVLCSHQLTQLNGKVDLSINTASFQEMERAQVKEYCDFISKHSEAAYIRNIKHSDFNQLTTADYQTMMEPMKIASKWENFLSPTYDALLLKTT